jgi:Fe-S-cluster-containing hydrogenase component 2
MCELACSSFKEGEFIPDRSRIRVIENRLEGWSRPAVCLQCEQPMCAAACPEGAIVRTQTPDGDSVVRVEQEKCVGCRSCMVACPFGAIAVFPKLMAVKCDLCDGSPKCVEFCFYGCLTFVELAEREERERAKKLNALILKAWQEISRAEVRRRQASFSLEASRITMPAGQREKDETIGLDVESLLRRDDNR